MNHHLHRPEMTTIAAAAVRGVPASDVSRTPRRLALLEAIINATIALNPTFASQALLLPAGFLRVNLRLGRLSGTGRARALDRSPLGRPLCSLARKLHRGGGGLLIVGVDTDFYDGFGGDHLVVAWSPDGVVGSARKVFPSVADTDGERRLPYLVFEHDADDPARVITLSDGAQALLAVCYDAFGFSDCSGGPTGKRHALQYLADPEVGWRWSTAAERHAIAERRAAQLTGGQYLGLVAVHGFEKPGREVYWQRHGIAAASAALDGRIVVGAAHFKRALPLLCAGTSGALAAVGVDHGHLTAGLGRKAHVLTAKAAVAVSEPGRKKPTALVRIFVA